MTRPTKRQSSARQALLRSRRRGLRRASVSIVRDSQPAHLETASLAAGSASDTSETDADISGDSAPDLAPAPRATRSIAAATSKIAGEDSAATAAVAAEAHVNPIPAFAAGGITAVAPLRGSFESLARQNTRTDDDGLERILDDADLHERIQRGFLVPVPVSDALNINQDLPVERRYCRPWTATFLKDLAEAHDKRFHAPLEISSAVRTVEYQKRLIRHNGNAAAATGEVVSPHVTGATIDIAKSHMTRDELYWMRQRLAVLQDAGKIDVEEEFRQACFHITVYKSYIGAGPAHHQHHPVDPDDDDDDEVPQTANAMPASN